MKKIILALVHVAFLFAMPQASLAQQQLVSDPEIYEKDHFSAQCKQVSFGPDFITRLDINNDGIIDAFSNHGLLECDGVKGETCDDEGCLYNFYVQVKEGGYLMIATARIYGYEFVKRYGNMVFVLKMHPKYCERTDSVPCEMTVRVRGTKFVTISKK